MTKQEILDEILRMPVNERVQMIANIAKSYVKDDEVFGEMLVKGNMRMGIVIATGCNADVIVDLCAKAMVDSMGDHPDNEFRSFDLRDKE